MTLSAPVGRFHILAAILIALGMATTVGGALGFQHLGGYIPCMLCLEQRTPYYLGIPVVLAALAAALARLPAWLVRGLFLACALVMTWSLFLALRHAGVEWGFWAGPADCGVAVMPSSPGGSLLDQLDAIVPPSCDQAAGRFLGLSFAGWNAVASLALAAFASYAAFRRA